MFFFHSDNVRQCFGKQRQKEALAPVILRLPVFFRLRVFVPALPFVSLRTCWCCRCCAVIRQKNPVCVPFLSLRLGSLFVCPFVFRPLLAHTSLISHNPALMPPTPRSFGPASHKVTRAHTECWGRHPNSFHTRSFSSGLDRWLYLTKTTTTARGPLMERC